MATSTKPDRPPIAPKPTIKKKPTTDPDTACSAKDCGEVETSSISSHSNSHISSEGPVPYDNHKHINSLDSSATSHSELDNDNANALAISAASSGSPSPPPRSKRMAKAKVSNESDVHMREKDERSSAERDSRPARGTVMFQVSNILAKTAEVSSTGKSFRSPVPKPRQKSVINESSPQVLSTSPAMTSLAVDKSSLSSCHTNADVEETIRVAPIPKPRNSLIQTESVATEEHAMANNTPSSDHEKTVSREDENSTLPTDQCQSSTTSDSNITLPENHYGEIWETKTQQENGSKIPNNNISSFGGLERAASVPQFSSSPKIKSRRPSGPPPSPPKQYSIVKKMPPLRPPPPSPKTIPVNPHANAAVRKDILDSSEDGTENFYYEAEVVEEGDSSCQIPAESGSADETQLARSSSESDAEPEPSVEMRAMKLKKKAYDVAHEIMTSEKEFYDKLVLLNIDFRQHLSAAAEQHGQPVVPADCINKILNQLPQLANINEDLLKDFQERMEGWEDDPRIADVFVRKGPFLQMYTTYIRDFQNMTTELDNAIKDYPEFAEALRAFEQSERCRNLQIRHYMLKPIQRIPQYRLLLSEYKKYLPSDSPDSDDVDIALEIVSKVADHANEAMKLNDSLQSLLELQSILIGDFRVIEPSRVLVRRGDVYKQSRKELQTRHLFLFNDYLVITTPQPGGHYKIKHTLPVLNMKANRRTQKDFQKEFEIITKKKSFIAVAFTPKECDNWVEILESTIAERERKISTYNKGLSESVDSREYKLGELAPVWVADDRVTMCMICSVSFSLTNRRHHCRACGKVVCGVCSVYRAPLKYDDYRASRCCGGCYEQLQSEASSLPGDAATRFYQTGKVYGNNTSKVRQVLKEVAANDLGECSGYLNVMNNNKRRWERYWFVLNKKVLYKYNACEDTAAIDTKPLLGYLVERVSSSNAGFDKTVVFKLSKPQTKLVEPMTFKTDSAESAENWIAKMHESTMA